MIPETHDELLTLFDEVLDDLKAKRDTVLRMHDAEFDALVCDLRDALERYEEATSITN